MAPGSIFLDFNLPNATTWLYFSFLLAVALFFKFSRVLSVRNWDVITVFLLVPGLLFLQEARPNTSQPDKHPAAAVASMVGSAAGGAVSAGPVAGAASGLTRGADLPSSSLLWFGYLWLLGGSAYLLLRCLFDLALVRRPALAPNLSPGGLAWLGGALFVCLVAVAFRDPPQRNSPAVSASAPEAATVKVGKETAPVQLVKSPFSQWAMRGLAVLCHLAVVVGLVLIGWRHFQDAPAGMAAATFYLMLPYTGQHVGQIHHVWPTALLVWALVCYRKPVLAGVFLGLAAGTIYIPLLLLPLWLSFYWRRGAGRFLVSFVATAGLVLGVTAAILMLSDEMARRIGETIAASDWQPWRVPTAEGIWTGVHWAYRIPVFVAFLAFVVTTALWPMPKTLGHVIALSAALLIGIQFWYADQGGVYVLWYLPLLMLLVFRPNLSDRYPPLVPSEADWLARLGRAAARGVSRLLRFPEPMVTARQ